MTSFHIAYDNNNNTLGKYFESCKSDLVDFIQNSIDGFSIDEIHSTLCNEVHLGIRLPQINTENFLFIAYSHGDEISLIANGNSYIAKGNNAHLFRNSFFYSTACLIGKELGPDLIANGCLAFIGNNEEVEVFLDGNRSLSIECDNVGIKMFILGHSIGTALKLMKAYYTQKIDRMYDLKQPLLAGVLVNCRESLVIYGNPDLTIDDFSS